MKAILPSLGGRSIVTPFLLNFSQKSYILSTPYATCPKWSPPLLGFSFSPIVCQFQRRIIFICGHKNKGEFPFRYFLAPDFFHTKFVDEKIQCSIQVLNTYHGMQIFHSAPLIMIVFQTNWQSKFSCSEASIITCKLTLMQVWDDP